MPADRPKTYSAGARHFHWWTFAFVAIQFILGFAMLVRASWLDIWDFLTNTLYSAHKLLGMIILLLVIARLFYRLRRGAPDDEPSLEPWQKIISHLTHWAIYALLILVPVIGWFGVQLYPALDVFGLFSLPAVVPPNQATSAWVLWLHSITAFALAFLLVMHVGAALFHHFIRKDGVLARMVPWLGGPDRPPGG